MKSHSGLFARLCQATHLEAAAAFTVRGKRRRKDVAWFLFRREDELRGLRKRLLAQPFVPEQLERVTIRDPKPRLIARLVIGERIIQNALVLLMEPVFGPSLRDEAYACRPGKGTHRAVLRLLELQRRFPYVLHLDVKKYFPSIDVSIVQQLAAQKIRDPRFLHVIGQFLEAGIEFYSDPETRRLAQLPEDWPPAGRGLPIGSATSQFLATHVYLNEFDHWVKRTLKVPGYLRYVDDLFLFATSRECLRDARSQVASWLASERHLRLKRPRARVLSCRGTLDALGYRLRREGLEARPRAFRRVERRLVAAQLVKPSSGSPDLERSLASSAGVVLF